MAPTYDDSGWPLVVITMPPASLSTAAFLEHLDRCSAFYRRGSPFCMLIDMDRHPSLPAVQRNMIGARMKEDLQRHPDRIQAAAVVVRSTFERGVVTAINWVAQPPYPVKCFAAVAEARVWLAKFLPASPRDAR